MSKQSDTDRITDGQRAKLAYEVLKPILDKIRNDRIDGSIALLRANDLSVDVACSVIYVLDIINEIETTITNIITLGHKAQLKEVK